MQMTALFWLYAGVALILFEVMTPGFVTLFFGISALTVAAVTWLFPALGQGWQWLLFAGLSIFYIILLRKAFKRIFVGDSTQLEELAGSDIGEVVLVTEAIAPSRPGRVELNGTSWRAEASEAIEPGSSVKVLERRNLTLLVERVAQ